MFIYFIFSRFCLWVHMCLTAAATTSSALNTMHCGLAVLELITTDLYLGSPVYRQAPGLKRNSMVLWKERKKKVREQETRMDMHTDDHCD